MSRASPTTSPRCTPKRGGKPIPLTVLPSGPAGGGRNAWESGHGTIRHSRVGKWRALVLILVHVAIAIHIVQWKLTGRTVSPVEPSESMETLREGAINAGFIFFALAILSTLVLGRWFCGWGCHLVALQDLCAWVMMKVGIKPKPLRARLLMWVPLGLAIYMFVWPVAHRMVIRPLVMDAAGRMPAWLGQSDPLPGVRSELIIEDFWATFAPWYWAIPFLGVCAFATVYFLGSKGFCTYGCPYGGFFAPADRLAVGRIRVTDACEHCGHCTAVCTSNVRVHEEVRDFGMVVDPGCMKCMDCVSTCPNEALYFGFGAPAVKIKPRSRAAEETAAEAAALRKARYDLRWYEEVAVLALFLLYFQSYRGMFNSVPMLMAVGLGGIMAFCTWKLWTMRPVKWGGIANSRLQNWQLRYRGRIRPVGWLLIAGTVVMMSVALWGGVVRVMLMRSELAFNRLHTPTDVALSPQFQATAAEAEAARRVIGLHTRAGPFWEDDPVRAAGVRAIGWEIPPDGELSLSYAHLILGEFDRALARIDRIIERGHPRDSLLEQAGRVIQAQEGARAKNEAEYREAMARAQARVLDMNRRALEKHDDLDGARAILAESAMRTSPDTASGRAAVEAIMGPALNARPARARAFLIMARFELALAQDGPLSGAVAQIDRALATEPLDEPGTLMEAAGLFAQMGGDPRGGAAMKERAVGLVERALTHAGKRGELEVSAAGLLAGLGRRDRAAELAAAGAGKARGVGAHTTQWQTLFSAGVLLARLERDDAAQGLIHEAVELLRKSMGDGRSAWSLFRIGTALMDLGAQRGQYLAEGVRALELARDDLPECGVVRYTLAMALYATERKDDAIREMTRAAELSDRNAFLARRLSELLAERGRAEDAARWEAIAKSREQMGPG
ncbi:MAG: 4Fe-4S binding protein [Phycisphaerales bacterium]|nr:4Fe-4S binding protein [Phycisphaerales bacterium]